MELSLYLIRHGETVDNVAGLYAGVRDSALSNHGVDQTQRLGAHFASAGIRFTHIFASPLSRAFKTAQAIQSAQPRDSADYDIHIVKVQELIEQDFGYYEGKTFQARTDAKKTGREAHRDRHVNDPGFVDVETKDSMNSRADVFLDQHLTPLFQDEQSDEPEVVAVVSHGMLLSHLWRRLLLRFPAKSVTIAPEVTSARGPVVLEHLGGWSNTGYLEIKMKCAAKADGVALTDDTTSIPLTASTSPTSTSAGHESSEHASRVVKAVPRSLVGWMLSIVAIDRKDHLVGLKRQRGGIGSSAHDGKQRKLDGFFKRQRTE